MKTVLVSAVALVDADGRVLIAQRPEGKAMAGLWEFPGGKIEPGETPEVQGRRATARARAKARAIHRESRRDDSIRACECFSFSSKSRAFIAIVSRVFTPRRSS